MKLISWNVNGLRACIGKGFLDFFYAENADVFCLQETKMQQEQFTESLPGYLQFWNSAEKKGYSGRLFFQIRNHVRFRTIRISEIRGRQKHHAGISGVFTS